MYASVGVLETHPKKTGGIDIDGTGWLVLHADPGISDFYISQFNFANRAKNVQLMRPSWHAHISIVRGEKIHNKELWDSLSGKEVEFKYDPINWLTGGKHYVFDVECEEVLDIREQLGLPRQPFYDLHLTIGVVKDPSMRISNLQV